KYGLPHLHILLILDLNSKPKTVDDYDAIVLAKIPNKDLHPKAFNTIHQTIMHDSCGSAYPNALCAISFNHLKTVNNIEYSTFKDIYEVLSMLQNDNKLDKCLNEV
ncbi:7544_t:CDS:2, partial [Cetraspora pellucida]